jgi:hypothetical protein
MVLTFSLAALAAAAPNELVSRNNDEVAAAIQYAALADGCSIIKCAEVIANVVCIGAAIVAEPETGGTSTAAVLACVKEGLDKVNISFPGDDVDADLHRSADVVPAFRACRTS